MKISKLEFKTSNHSYSYDGECYLSCCKLEIVVDGNVLIEHFVDAGSSTGHLLRLLDDIKEGLPPKISEYPNLYPPSRDKTLFSGADNWEDEKIWAEPELSGDNLIFRKITFYGAGNSRELPGFAVSVDNFRRQTLEFVAKDIFFRDSVVELQRSEKQTASKMPKEFLNTEFKARDEYTAELEERFREAGLEKNKIWRAIADRKGNPSLLTWSQTEWPGEKEPKVTIVAKKVEL